MIILNNNTGSPPRKSADRQEEPISAGNLTPFTLIRFLTNLRLKENTTGCAHSSNPFPENISEPYRPIVLTRGITLKSSNSSIRDGHRVCYKDSCGKPATEKHFPPNLTAVEKRNFGLRFLGQSVWLFTLYGWTLVHLHHHTEENLLRLECCT